MTCSQPSKPNRQVSFVDETECVTFDPNNAVEIHSQLIVVEKLAEEGSQRVLESNPLDKTESVKLLAVCSILIFLIIGPFLSFNCNFHSTLLGYRENLVSLAFLGSSSTAILFGGFPFAALLTDRFGHRLITLVGVWLSSIGLLLASFSIQLWQLVFSRSIIVGVGGSLVFYSCFTLPLSWFRYRRLIPITVCSISLGLGGLVNSIASEIDYNARYWLRIQSATVLIVGSFATFCLKRRTPSLSKGFIVDWKLLKDFRILLLCLIAFVSSLGLLVPVYVFPIFASSYNFSNKQVSILIASLNGGLMLGSVLLGFLAIRIKVPFIIMIGMLCGGLTGLSLWLFNSGIVLLTGFSLLHGTLSSSFFILSPMVVFSLSGSSGAFHVFGLVNTAYGLGFFMGPPTMAYVASSYNMLGESWPYPYLPVVLFTSFSTILGGFLMLWVAKIRSSAKPCNFIP